jgi:hypothetical protein
LWRSVLLVGETGEKHWPVARHWQMQSHNVVHLALSGVLSGDNSSQVMRAKKSIHK